VSSVLAALAMASLITTPSADSLEIVQPSPDGMGFELSESGVPFVLFGANAVVDTGDPDDPWALYLLTPEGWNPERLERMLDGAADLGMNHIKAFLPIGHVLPDPQPVDGAVLVEGTEERVLALLDAAEARGIRISLALAAWGGNGCEWWQEGGQYWGAMDRVMPRDSFATLADFWRQIALLCHGRGALLSYNLATEWTLPNINLTWQREHDGLVPGPHALPAFRYYLHLLYENDIDALSLAWGQELASFEDVTLPDLSWDGESYGSPDGKVRDWNEFREWTSRRYLRMQADAIREVDPAHMVTCGVHGRTPADQWPGSAMHVMGCTSRDLADFLDYVTVHHYVQNGDVEKGLRMGELLARFAWNGAPVVIEEFGYMPAEDEPDPGSTTADVMVDLMRRTADDVAGWSVWYYTNTRGATALDVEGEVRYGPYDSGWELTELGRRLRELSEEGFFTGPTTRVPPEEDVLFVDRAECMVPREMGILLKIAADWDAYEHPVGFEYPPPPLD
jgi:hypothetical protein